MWPWEHVIVGYVAYSVLAHIVYRDAPGGLETITVVFAAVLPDLIDKPLAWEYGVFASGYALGHSVFFAVPLALFVGALARAGVRPRVGVAFAVGYLLHLPADVFDTYARGGGIRPEIVLWPVVTSEGDPHHDGLFEVFTTLFSGYAEQLLSGEPSTYLLGILGLTVAAVVLWVYDGCPPVPETGRGAMGVVRRLRS